MSNKGMRTHIETAKITIPTHLLISELVETALKVLMSCSCCHNFSKSSWFKINLLTQKNEDDDAYKETSKAENE